MLNRDDIPKRFMLIFVSVWLVFVFQGITSGRGKSKIYWTESGVGIRWANLDGSNIEELVPNLIQPNDIALDQINGKIYWVDDHTAKTQRANLDGSNIETIFTAFKFPGGERRMLRNCNNGKCVVKAFPKNGEPVEVPLDKLIYPRCITVDSRTNKLYWGNNYFSDIQRANLDGTNVEDLVTKEVAGVWDIKLDLKAGKMYWAERGGEKIRRANLNGTITEDIVLNRPDILSGIALDVRAGYIYWSIPHKGTIRRASLNGNNIEDHITGLNYPKKIVLDPQSQNIYWVSWDRKTNTHKIQRANLDGSNVTDILTDLKFVSGIALDAEGAYDVTPDKTKLTTTWANVKVQ